jgi:hypothetical protein
VAASTSTSDSTAGEYRHRLRRRARLGSGHRRIGRHRHRQRCRVDRRSSDQRERRNGTDHRHTDQQRRTERTGLVIADLRATAVRRDPVGRYRAEPDDPQRLAFGRESGSAASTRESQSNNDWLNVGYADSGTYDASDSVWSDPTTAATRRPRGCGSGLVAGYGASAGVQPIRSSIGQPPPPSCRRSRGRGRSSVGDPSFDAPYQQSPESPRRRRRLPDDQGSDSRVGAAPSSEPVSRAQPPRGAARAWDLSRRW